MAERAPSDEGTAGPLWDEALADFERMLDGYLAISIAAHDPSGDPAPAIPEFTPPADLGPLPERLRLQATELAFRARLIETELARVRDMTAVELAALNRPRAAYDRERAGGRLDAVG